MNDTLSPNATPDVSCTHWKRTFAVIWGGQAVSIITSAIVQYAIIWYITARTGSAAMLALATGVAFLPQALFASFTGSLADRYDRKKIMIFADCFVAAAALVLALFAMKGDLPLPLVYAVLFCRALGSTFHEPALQAVTPLIVPPDMLTKCAGYAQAVMSVSFIASPAIAAVLYAALDMPIIIMLDVIGAAFGCLAVALVKIPRLKKTDAALTAEKPHLIRDTIAGYKLLLSFRGIRMLVLVGFLFTFAYLPAASLTPLMCMGYFGQTASAAGFAETVFSAGMLVGGIIIGIWGGFKNRLVTMTLSTLLLGVLFAGAGLLPPTAFGVFVAGAGIMGFSCPFFNAPCMSLYQEKVPPEYLGRIMGVSASSMSLAGPLGLVISGLFAEAVGVNTWFVIAGIAVCLCVIPMVASREIRDLQKPVETAREM
ncbi:MFS transporter [Treponema brennaborense]|uniref:Major facilitator superfamily MFS_1 n=1 Tax=Treponema brennaborense (strain DSM 12168 / CIP 105900 / DD5/3) TaxID=906968 RepID=F4LP04_TREBD|nr:MFS transporter [Treponema brennaborense]AEE17981.1 major facilitator superfamily MFS_1 [Treponema brennaborense DSM 12168]